METKLKNKVKTKAASVKDSKAAKQKPKSKIVLFWEKYPNGIGTIVNMKAVLK